MIYPMYHNNTFADDLKQSCIDTWNKILNHTFLTEISTNALPIGKFIFYLKQDRIFLIEFCSFLQAVKQKSHDDVHLAELFDKLLCSTINFEMQMQNQILNSLGISSDSSLNSIPSTTTLSYTSYLRKVSLLSSSSPADNMGIIVSAMAPCPWTYFEIAEKLSRYNIENHTYRKWVQFYSSRESYVQVEDLKNILCALAKESTNKDKLAMKRYFATACNYELLFWDMAYNTTTT
jgi:thiaminase/transcriptional activator TenA